MKGIKYILMVFGLVSVLSVSAQIPTSNWGKLPEARMYSTSTMAYSGSTLPQAAVTGVMVTGSRVGTYSPASKPHPGHVRRLVGEDDGFENEGTGTGDLNNEPTTGKPGEPDPIGDVLWPLLMMACAYAALRYRKREKEQSI